MKHWIPESEHAQWLANPNRHVHGQDVRHNQLRDRTNRPTRVINFSFGDSNSEERRLPLGSRLGEGFAMLCDETSDL